MRITLAVAAAIVLLSSGCVPRTAPPPAPAPSVARPVPLPTPVPVPSLSSDWRDWPITPGSWSYRPPEFGRSQATFGNEAASLFSIACNAGTRTVTLSRPGAPGAPPNTVRTSTTTRSLATDDVIHSGARPPMTHDMRLPANDPLLDAIGFSRGRFIVEEQGSAPLVIPAWPEILRVIEDCRG